MITIQIDRTDINRFPVPDAGKVVSLLSTHYYLTFHLYKTTLVCDLANLRLLLIGDALVEIDYSVGVSADYPAGGQLSTLKDEYNRLNLAKTGKPSNWEDILKR